MAAALARYPTWLQDLDGSLAVRSQFVLSGNIRDSFLLDEGQGPFLASIVPALWSCLQASGYELLVVHDRVDGVQVWPDEDRTREVASAVLRRSIGSDPADVSLPKLRELLGLVVDDREHRVAFVLDYASRLPEQLSSLTPEQHEFFAFAEKLSHSAKPLYCDGADRPSLFNPVIWLVANERDLPDWLVVGNDRLRLINVPLPDLESRQRAADVLMPSFSDFSTRTDDEQHELTRRFTGLADGLTMAEMLEVTRLARDRGFSSQEVGDAVRAFRVGIRDNPWKGEALRLRIQRADGPADDHGALRARVRGQEPAVTHALDILKRAAMGLSGAQARSSGSRPRGVLFFAGPTGVGKTELAKALAELVFGNDQAMIRFDMSEFSAEQAEARLIGSPPGYVGHDAGGQLTDAVRDRPFSLLLFDEVEKAHPRILDKFLQILEDGRLTDGRGMTVHFSETVIVFTSNLGIYEVDEQGVWRPTVTWDMHLPYSEVEQRVRTAIEDHFKRRLNRPELLNRLGDNIVVFDFISADVGAEIFAMDLANVLGRVAEEQRVTITVADDVERELRDRCLADLSNGGRGIGGVLETAFVNPLARALFDTAPAPGDHLTVRRLVEEDAGITLELG